jgi:hypothetical protein
MADRTPRERQQHLESIHDRMESLRQHRAVMPSPAVDAASEEWYGSLAAMKAIEGEAGNGMSLVTARVVEGAA